ncbi:MAG: hypothetical protein R6U96_10385 [Promethearchaeia archaeon]
MNDTGYGALTGGGCSNIVGFPKQLKPICSWNRVLVNRSNLRLIV